MKLIAATTFALAGLYAAAIGSFGIDPAEDPAVLCAVPLVAFILGVMLVPAGLGTKEQRRQVLDKRLQDVYQTSPSAWLALARDREGEIQLQDYDRGRWVRWLLFAVFVVTALLALSWWVR